MTKLEMVDTITARRVQIYDCDRYRMKKALGRMTTKEIEMIYKKEIENN